MPFLRRALPRVIAWMALLAPCTVWAQPFADYVVDVKLEPERHVISGTIQITLEEDDPRVSSEWWLHLPPNRFLEPDRRGVRRRIDSLSVGVNYSEPDRYDPMLPDGFSKGGIEIVSVVDDKGQPLTISYEDNLAIPKGYAPRDGLMRVGMGPDSSGRQVTIRFVTTLPHRHVDGWADGVIVAEHWHPVLLNNRKGRWNRDVFDPRGGRYSGDILTTRPGWLLVGRERPARLARRNTLHVPRRRDPTQQMTLLFTDRMNLVKGDAADVHLNAFFQSGHARIGALAMVVAENFYGFMKIRFGMALPVPTLTLVETGLLQREMVRVGNVVLIPSVFFRNNALLDRVFVGKLSRVLAESWFGGTVWANPNTDAWLHLGLTGYFSLEFYRFLYGWDASIHDLVDWLSPKYREHFFETRVLALIRDRRDAPITIPLYDYPIEGVAMVNHFQKTPLVMRSLVYVVGEDSFRFGIQAFFDRKQFQVATLLEFQEILEDESGEPLAWFFNQWFRGTTRVDYGLGQWHSEPVAGGYRVTVEVLKNEPGIMPVEVQIQLADGTEDRKRIDGAATSQWVDFLVDQPVTRIVLDPEEYLLETNRKNNQSFQAVRYRPFYDWSKQRETLVTVFSRLGGNAIDGNIVGVGANLKLNDGNAFRFVPIYGENTPEVLFEAGYSRTHFLNPRVTLAIEAFRLGGKESLISGVTYNHATPDATIIDSSYLLQVEQVGASSVISNQTSPIQQAGSINSLKFVQKGGVRVARPFTTNWLVEIEHSQADFLSDFSYTSVLARAGQDIDLNHNHAFRFELVRGWIDGNAPVQKQFLLGDPLTLRGYPRTVELVHSNILAVRLEYHWVVTRGILGESVQTRRTTLFFFTDVGIGWSNTQLAKDAPTRRDVGVGLNVDLDTMSLLTFPVRIEVAVPVGDRDYKDRQVIFFQALAFF